MKWLKYKSMYCGDYNYDPLFEDNIEDIPIEDIIAEKINEWSDRAIYDDIEYYLIDTIDVPILYLEEVTTNYYNTITNIEKKYEMLQTEFNSRIQNIESIDEFK